MVSIHRMRTVVPALAIAATVATQSISARAAFGSSPPWIRHGAVLQGTTYTQVVAFSTNDPDSISFLSYELVGCPSELTSWLEFETPDGSNWDGSETPWPAGEHVFPVTARVRVPASADLGQTVCSWRVNTTNGPPDSGVGIGLGANITVDITVTDQPALDFWTAPVDPNPRYMDLGQPVGLTLSVWNNSNIDIETIPVQIQVWDLALGAGYTGTDFTLEAASDQIFPPVPAYQTSPRPQTEIFFPHILPVGAYYARVRTENQDGPDNDSVMYVEVKNCPACTLLHHEQGSCGGEPTLIEPDGAACDNGDKCTVGDTCASGVCVAGTPKPCPAPDVCRLDGTCDSTLGGCVYPSALEGTPCDDSNACTLKDACESGHCTGTDPVECSASDACHDVGVCDTDTGVCSDPAMPDGTTCPSGTCQNGVCAAGAAGASGSAGAAGSAGSAGGPGTGGTASVGGNAGTGGITDAGGSAGSGGSVDAGDLDATTDGGSLGLPLTGTPRQEEGCACRTGPGRSSLGWIPALVGFALLLRRRASR